MKNICECLQKRIHIVNTYGECSCMSALGLDTSRVRGLFSYKKSYMITDDGFDVMERIHMEI